jgi:hypothetical protein
MGTTLAAGCLPFQNHLTVLLHFMLRLLYHPVLHVHAYLTHVSITPLSLHATVFKVWSA